METLERRPHKTCDYVLLRSEQVIHICVLNEVMLKPLLQLVGTALLVIVRSDLTAVIRNVEGAARKVGLKSTTQKHDLNIISRLVYVACPETKVVLESDWIIMTLASAS